MKARVPLAVVVILILLASLGGFVSTASPPAGNTPPVEHRLTAQDNGHVVHLKGQVLTIDLESNPSTGYTWMAEGLNKGILRQIGEPEWVSKTPGLLGAPGTQTVRFAGLARGQAILNLVYRRPWEAGVKPARSFSVQVQVDEPSRNVQNLPAAPAGAQEPAAPAGGASTLALPTAYNWCTLGGCTPIRNQGQCGSCWAFGSVGPLESAILLQDGVSRDLSEQYLVSCNIDGWGCDGGWWAHDYHEWKYSSVEPGPGAVNESDFRYTATDAPCNGPHTHYEKIADWVYIGNDRSVPSTDAIKQAIYDHGPVAAAVCVNTAFQNYTGGIFNPGGLCLTINHAIVLVGWDDSKGAWRLRNSWGPNWGENGYMWIAYGKSYVGYSANYVVYQGTEPTPPPPPTATPTPEPPTPTPSPAPSGSMHVSAIDMSYAKSGKNYVVYTTVTIVDDQGSAVAGATVSIKTTVGTKAVATSSGLTAADGKVTFSVKSKTAGTYTSTVTNVTHSSYTYDPAANVLTTKSLVVP
jgi:predicted secreted protein